MENICRREKKNKQSKNLLAIDSHVYKCVGTCVCVRQREGHFLSDQRTFTGLYSYYMGDVL